MVDGPNLANFREHEQATMQAEQDAIVAAVMELSELSGEHLPGQTALELDPSSAAMTLAYTRLATSVPYGENFGYQTAREAADWLSYTDAVIRDKQQRGQLTGGWLEQLGLDHLRQNYDLAGGQLSKRNPFFFGSFARLTRIRRELEEAGKSLTDPFALEHKVVLRVLKNAALAANQSRGAHAGGRNRAHKVTINGEPELETPTYVISQRIVPREAKEEVVVEFVPATDDDAPVNANGDILPVRSLTVVETPEGVKAEFKPQDAATAAVIEKLEEKYDLPEPSTPGLLITAQALQPEPEAKIFEFPTSDIPELEKLAQAA